MGRYAGLACVNVTRGDGLSLWDEGTEASALAWLEVATVGYMLGRV
jgi:hypothetical protein